jgi:hypothetical protein
MNLKTTEMAGTAGLAVLPPGHALAEAALGWPWMAAGAVLLLLLVIARFSRRLP